MVVRKVVNNINTEEILNKLLEGQQKMARRLSSVESQQKENNQILRALEHSSEVHKSELDKLNIQVAKLAGNEKKIKRLEDNLKNHDHNITIKSDKANVS